MLRFWLWIAPWFPETKFSYSQEPDVQSQFMNDHDASGLTASSSSKERNIDPFSPNSAIAEKSRKFQFSFAGKTTKTFDLQQDISKYIRNFEKHDLDSEIASSNCYNMDEYNLQASAESLLFDRGLLRNRIESGSLLLCGGSFTISFSPFASIIWNPTSHMWSWDYFYAQQKKNTCIKPCNFAPLLLVM